MFDKIATYEGEDTLSPPRHFILLALPNGKRSRTIGIFYGIGKYRTLS
ncbi:MAG: hypothetical protein ABIH40_02720 [Candidatus Omnitrophota bacterium]